MVKNGQWLLYRFYRHLQPFIASTDGTYPLVHQQLSNWKITISLQVIYMSSINQGKIDINYRTQVWKITMFNGEEQLFLWPCSIAMLNYQRVCVCYCFFVSIIQLGSLACNLKHPHSGSKYVVSSPTKPCFLGGV